MIAIEQTPDLQRTQMPDFTKPLALLTHCHKKIENQLCALEQVAGKLRDGSCQTRKIERLDALVAALCALYRPHMRIEDELVFPAAARLLLPSDIQAIGEEMRARRRLILQKAAKSQGGNTPI